MTAGITGAATGAVPTHLGHPVRSFVSLTGPPYGENAVTDELVRESGFEFVFSNFRIQRVGGTVPVSGDSRAIKF